MGEKNFIYFMILAVSLGACSGSQTESGQISLQVENSRTPSGFAALKIGSVYDDILTVTKFKVTISGQGIDPPITAEADAASTQIQVLDILPGNARTILIEAFNASGKLLRHRQIDGITIEPGVVTPIQTSLNTIPIILNLSPGSVVLSENLHVVGFGEPGSSIRIDAESTNQTVSYSQSLDGSPIVVSPSLSTGLFDFTPPQTFLGKQTITAVDESTGETSAITVYVVQGSSRPGRHLISSGSLGPTTVVGQSFGGSKEANFPLVLRLLNGQLIQKNEK